MKKMKALVVEDEIFVAIEVEHVLEEMGFDVVGIASDSTTARKLGSAADIAIVDLNLNDGPTGEKLGEHLACEHGVTVIYMTANPSQIQGAPRGTLGILPKPASDEALRAAIGFARAKRAHKAVEPVRHLMLFED